jgi:hypothetical protein
LSQPLTSHSSRYKHGGKSYQNGVNKENEFHGNNNNINGGMSDLLLSICECNTFYLESLPNIRVQRMHGVLPYITEKLGDLPPIGHPNHHRSMNGQVTDSFALPTLSDFTYKSSKKKNKYGKSKKGGGGGNSNNNKQQERATTPQGGSVYSSTDFYPMRSRSPNESMNSGTLYTGSKNNNSMKLSHHGKSKRKQIN